MAGSVLFFPYYLYLHLDAFRRVIECLGAQGHEGECVYIRYGQDESPFAAPRIAAGGWRDLRVSTTPVGMPTLSRLLAVPSLMLARAQITRFLDSERPSLVVVGSDLGDRHIRVLLDRCTQLEVPVLIVATVGATRGAVKLKPAQSPIPPSMLPMIRAALRPIGLDRAMLFNGQTIGSYHRNATIAVPGPAMKDYLVGEGIAAERVIVTGSPVHDGLCRMAATPAVAVKAAVCHELNMSPDSRLVVYCTERIQDVYGAQYMVELNRSLAAALTKLPAGYRLLIKLHPRESSEDEAVYRQMFTDDRFRIVRVVGDLYGLLHAADVVISHMSATLVDAAIMGSATLSINVRGDRSRFIFGEQHDHLYVLSMDELASKVVSLVADSQFAVEATRQRDCWRQRYAYQVDGKAAQRIATLATSLMASRQASRS